MDLLANPLKNLPKELILWKALYNMSLTIEVL